jgi:hypothetical protein
MRTLPVFNKQAAGQERESHEIQRFDRVPEDGRRDREGFADLAARQILPGWMHGLPVPMKCPNFWS